MVNYGTATQLAHGRLRTTDVRLDKGNQMRFSHVSDVSCESDRSSR